MISKKLELCLGAQLVIQAGKGDAQLLSGLFFACQIPAVAQKRFFDLFFFKAAHPLGQRQLCSAVSKETVGQSGGGDDAVGGEIGGELQHVAQFPDVSRPAVGAQALQRRRRG